MTDTCYMCDKPATTREHAPPKCVFPEQKDAGGKDYRSSLTTVPSCDDHNLRKSHDDEYVMMVITSYFQNNQAAQAQINSKIVRAWARAPGLAQEVVKNLQTIHLGSAQQYAYEVDTARFDRVLSWCANALYFSVFAQHCEPQFKVISYPLVQLHGDGASTVNTGRARILLLANQMLCGLPRRGANPEVFWFQVSPVVEDWCVLRMVFFAAFQVVAVSSPWLEA